MSKALNFQGPLRLAIAEGATAPNSGQIGSSVWSTVLNRAVWWTGSAWSAFAPPVSAVGAAGVNVQSFSSPGTSSWVKPAGAALVQAFIFGATGCIQNGVDPTPALSSMTAETGPTPSGNTATITSSSAYPGYELWHAAGPTGGDFATLGLQSGWWAKASFATPIFPASFTLRGRFTNEYPLTSVIEGSDDDVTWDMLRSDIGSLAYGLGAQVFTVAASKTYKHLRLRVLTGVGNNTGLSRFMINELLGFAVVEAVTPKSAFFIPSDLGATVPVNVGAGGFSDPLNGSKDGQKSEFFTLSVAGGIGTRPSTENGTAGRVVVITHTA